MLSLDDKNPALTLALNFLKSTQNQDGGWSTAPSEGKSDWSSGPALFALGTTSRRLADSKSASACERGAHFLAEMPTELYSAGARIILGALQGVKAVDEAPRGWPWSRDCFHWVEPTSYNLYALKIPQRSNNKNREFVQLIDRANKYLLQNTCSVGGWNHGSHLALGVNLPPYIVTTAEALLALQDMSTHSEIGKAFDFLGAHTEAFKAGQTKSAMALAWLTLTFHAYGKDSQKSLAALISSQNPDGSFGPNMMVTALASMALATEDGINPFKMELPNNTPDSKKTDGPQQPLTPS